MLHCERVLLSRYKSRGVCEENIVKRNLIWQYLVMTFITIFMGDNREVVKMKKLKFLSLSSFKGWMK